METIMLGFVILVIILNLHISFKMRRVRGNWQQAKLHLMISFGLAVSLTYVLV